MIRHRSHGPVAKSVVASAALLAAVSVVIAGDPGPVTAVATDDCIAIQDYRSIREDGEDPVFVYDVDGAIAGTLPSARTISSTGQRADITDFGRKISLGDLSSSAMEVIYEFDKGGNALDYGYRLLFSPTGEHLAFIGATNTIFNDFQLIVIDLDGNETLRTTVDVWDTGYDFSPDGKEIAYIEDGGVFRGTHVWVAPTDGSGPPVKIVNHTQSDSALPPYFPPKSLRNIKWSPDGTMIALQGRDGIGVGHPTKNPVGSETYIMNADGTDLREVAAEPGVTEKTRTVPVWSPDSKKIAYSQVDIPAGSQFYEDYDIAVYDIANDEITEIPGTDGLFVNPQWAQIEWSASSDNIVFTGSKDLPNFEFLHGVWSIPASGGTPQLLFETESQPFDEPFIGLIPCSIVPAPAFNGLTPARLMDTRIGLGAPKGVVGPNGTVSLEVLGVGGVPSAGVDAVALNVTVTGTTSPSFLTVFPHGVPRPEASNLNWDGPGVTKPNSVVVKVGSGGMVDLYNLAGNTHVIVDVAGWFGAGAFFEAITPTRLLDTRVPIGVPFAREVRQTQIGLAVHGATIPKSGSGVILNTTATRVTGPSFVTVFPGDVTRPEASNLNIFPGLTSSNLVFSGIGNGGVNFFNGQHSTHLIADAAGWLEHGSGYIGMTPSRIIDTRDTARLAADTVLNLPVVGVENGVPAGASVVIANVTAVAPTAPSFLTVYPGGVDRPEASNLNFFPGQVVPNLVLATIGADGSINIYNAQGDVHVIVDVLGYFV